MKEISTPKYYQRFQCIGSACEDTCCGHYRVNVDHKSMKFLLYKSKIKSDIVNVFEATVTAEPKVKKSFVLDHNGKCPLLNEEKLCKIYIHDGPERMPQICQEYPRLRAARPRGERERDLSLACPEAVRQLLFEQDAMQMDITHERGPIEKEQLKYNRPAYGALLRHFIADILQIPDGNLEENIYTAGLVLANLSPYKDQPLEVITEAMQQLHGQVAAGYMRLIYQEQETSWHHQSLAFGGMLNLCYQHLIRRVKNRAARACSIYIRC